MLLGKPLKMPPCWLKEMGRGSEKPKKFRVEAKACCRMPECPERKTPLKYVHRILVFIEVILLSASGRSKRP